MVASDAFLEYANFSGNWYGTSFGAIKSVQDAGRICILDVDLAGVKAIKRHLAAKDGHQHQDTAARYIFVRPPGKENLETRLRGRGSETEESLARRLARVDADFEYADQPGNYDLILVNGEVDSAYRSLVSFIFELEEEAQQ